MKRSFGLFVVLVLSAACTSQAAIVLHQNDQVKFVGQASGASVGYGGAFNWTVVQGASKGKTFQSFCVEIQQDISPGSTYSVSSIFAPKTGKALNSSGNILGDYKGIYLFDVWSENEKLQTADNAGAVQLALWESEGYKFRDGQGQLISSMLSSIGYSATQFTTDEGLIAGLLQTQLSDGSVWSTSWKPDDVNAIELTCGNVNAQDQVVLVPTYNNNGAPAPEPTTVVIWGVGMGLAGAAALRRRKQPHGRWSEENRQAIFHIIEGKR